MIFPLCRASVVPNPLFGKPVALAELLPTGSGASTRWKSLQSGTTKILRRDSDRIYAETVLSEAQKNAGCFFLSDLQKKGDIFSGTVRSSCVCEYTRGLGAYERTFTNRVTDETSIEITGMTPTRIEGRVMARPKGTKFDCKKAEFSKPPSEWQNFTWIPE